MVAGKTVKKVAKKTSQPAAKRTAKQAESVAHDVVERHGASIRAKCTNSRCENHNITQIVKLERKGDIYYVPFMMCAKCLYEVTIVDDKLREAFQGA